MKNCVSGKHHFRHSQKLGYRNSDSSDLSTSNGGGYVLFEHAIVDCCEEACVFCKEWVPGKRYFRYRQKLGNLDSDSSDLSTSNGGG